MSGEDLADWIKQKMIVDQKSVLEVNKEAISRYIGITSAGDPVLLVEKTQLKGQQAVMFYLIGKYMAKIAGCSDDAGASYSEVFRSLGLPRGTVGRCLRELEGAGMAVNRADGKYEIVLSSLATFFANLGSD
jgi:hypothetical protein